MADLPDFETYMDEAEAEIPDEYRADKEQFAKLDAYVHNALQKSESAAFEIDKGISDGERSVVQAVESLNKARNLLRDIADQSGERAGKR